MARSLPIPSHPPADEAGFVLPLSLGAAFMLLLSSLSLSAAALQAHQLHGAERTQQQDQDLLASGAHLLAGELQGAYSCLLKIPSSQWQTRGQMQPCPEGLNLEPLQHSDGAGSGAVLLRQWLPDGSGSGGELWVQVGETGLQKRYTLSLEPGQGLREVG